MSKTIKKVNGRKYVQLPTVKEAIDKYNFYNPLRPPFKEPDITALSTPKKKKPFINLNFDKLQIGSRLIQRGSEISIEIVQKIDSNYIAYDKLQNTYLIKKSNAQLYRHPRYNKPPKRMFINSKPNKDSDKTCPIYPEPKSVFNTNKSKSSKNTNKRKQLDNQVAKLFEQMNLK